MEDYNLVLARPEMDVRDRDGEKVGTVVRVYQATLAPVGGTGNPSGSLVYRGGVVEVRTGLLGLGRHLYIPAHAIADATADCLFLDVSRDALVALRWHVKPDLSDRAN